VHPKPARECRDRIVRDGQDDQLHLFDQGFRIGEGAIDLHKRPEALATTDVTAGDGVDRPAGPRQGNAKGGPDRTRADDPDHGRRAVRACRITTGWMRWPTGSSWPARR